MVRLLVLLAIGLGAAWGYCRFTTPCYEARCECEVSFGDAAGGGFGGSLDTRLAVWQSALGKELAGVDVERVPRSRLIAVIARGARAEDVASRANFAAEAIVSYTTNSTASHATATVAQLHAEVERLRAEDERLDKKLLEIRTANASEGGASARRHLEESLSKTIANIKEQERRVREAGAWADFLEMARTHPKDLGAFPASVPESSEVRRAHKAWSAARGRLANLRTKYTEEHPEIEAAKIALVATAKEFADVLVGASAVAEGELTTAQSQLKELRRKAGALRADLERMEIVTTEASGGIERLEQEKKVARELYEAALRKENEMRVNVGQNVDLVRVVRAASVPKEPLYPDPELAYSIGAGVPLALWVFLGILWPLAPRRHTQPHAHEHSRHHSHDHAHEHSHHHSQDHSQDYSHHHSHEHSHHHSHDGHAHHHSHDHSSYYSHDHSHEHSHHHSHDGHAHHHSHEHSHHRRHSI